MNKTQKWIIGAAAAVFTTWAMFVLTPAVAHADESSYINGIYEHNVPVTSTVLALGHGICDTISHNGVAGVEAEARTATAEGVSAHDSAVIIVEAVYELCPSNKPALYAWLYPTTKS
jgi:hypothetical protein